MKKLKLFALCAAIITTFHSQAQIVNTVAGTGVAGFLGDGGLGTAARINNPQGLEVDGAGNIYFADRTNHRIRKISISGVISTIAGTGVATFTGDGGPATAAAINTPFDLKFDGSGNLYFSDGFNHRVRKINTAGIISTVAGTGAVGSSGDGGAASLASINSPAGITFDAAGNLYFADLSAHRVRKIDMSTGIITTVAGTGATGYSGDGGAATAASLWVPNYLYMDVADNLYITDNGNHRIRKVTPAGIISTFAGNGIAGYTGDGGLATAARLNYPGGMTMDATGNAYIADDINHGIRKVSSSGIITTFGGIGSAGYGGDGGPIAGAMFNTPVDVAFDALGNFVISDLQDNRVRRTLLAGNTPPAFVETGVPSLSICGGTVKILDTLLKVADGNTFQILSWSVVQSPYHGTLSGFSATATSTGTTTMPSSVALTPAIAYTGPDSFKIRVFDGFAADTLTVLLSVSPGPVVPVISGTAALCMGSSTTLTTIGTGGVWTSGNPAIATVSSSGGVLGTGGGAVTITYAVSSSCGITMDVFNMTVDVPATPVISGVSAFCAGTYTILSSTPLGGIWSSGAPGIASVSSSGIVSGITGGTVNITYTVSNSCGTDIGVLGMIVDPPAVSPAIAGASALCVGSSTTLTTTGAGGVWTSGAPGVATVSSSGVVNAVSGGVVFISYSITNSCGTALAAHGMTIDAAPVSATITGTAAVCVGSATTLSVSIPGGAWVSGTPSVATVAGSGVVTGMSAGTAVLTYNVTNACGSEPALITVSVNPLPSAAPVTGIDSVCPGKKITLADATAGGTWQSSNTAVGTIATTGVFTGVAMGSVTVRYIVTNSCGSDTAVKVITVRNPKICNLAISDVDRGGNIGVSITPNPNNGLFTLSVRSWKEEEMHVEIYNVLGVKVHDLMIEANTEVNVDVRLAPGIYMLSAAGQSEQYFTKMLVN